MGEHYEHLSLHWEADLMLFAACGQAILVAHERKSRILLLAKQPSKAAQPTVQQLLAWLQPLPDRLRQTITFDNGTEFALHHQLNTQLGMQTFFCDTHSPWQKGGIENAIGRMRRPLPRKTTLARLDTDTLNASVAIYNNTPRKCLGFQSPAEAFLSQLLHFKCESIGTDQSQWPSCQTQPSGRCTQWPGAQAACSRGGSMYLPCIQVYLSRSQPQCPGVHTIRGPGGGGGVSACAAGGAVGAMIVVDTVLPAPGPSSLVIVFFSIVIVDWAKAGAANSKIAPATTSGRIILIPSIGSRAASVAGRLWESTG
jgi:hypothetical protein